MDSPSTVLGVSPDATISQVETAYREKWTYWNDLRHVPSRAAEAEREIARLDLAHEQLLAWFRQGEGRLVDPAPSPTAPLLGAGAAARAGVSAGKPVIDPNVCPKCGTREDAPDAVYCTNKDCRFELKSPCPACGHRIAWYKEICPYCGIDVVSRRDEQRRQQETYQDNQIMALKHQLQDLNADLVWLESGGALWSPYGKSAAIRDKYGVSLDSGAGCLYSLSVMAGCGIIWFIVVQVGGQTSPFVIFNIAFGMVAWFFVATIFWMSKRNSRNRAEVQSRIEERTATVKQQLALQEFE